MFDKVKNKKEKKGFTLIELLLYIALSTLVLFVTSMFLISLLEARVKNQTIATVDQEGNRAMSIITQTIRNSTSINSPTIGNDSAILSLNTGVVENDPTVFDLSDGVIRMTEGSNPSVNLTSNLVIITNLNFRNLSRPDTPGNIDVTFNVTHIH